MRPALVGHVRACRAFGALAVRLSALDEELFCPRCSPERIGCGGGDDLRMFVTAWRRLESARVTGPTLGPGFLGAPVATLELVPTS
jgi:hypothetical protein